MPNKAPSYPIWDRRQPTKPASHMVQAHGAHERTSGAQQHAQSGPEMTKPRPAGTERGGDRKSPTVAEGRTHGRPDELSEDVRGVSGAAVAPACQRGAPPVSCSGVRSRKPPAHIGAAGRDRAVVTDDTPQEGGQDRRNGARSRAPHDLPAGRSDGVPGSVPPHSGPHQHVALMRHSPMLSPPRTAHTKGDMRPECTRRPPPRRTSGLVWPVDGLSHSLLAEAAHDAVAGGLGAAQNHRKADCSRYAVTTSHTPRYRAELSDGRVCK